MPLVSCIMPTGDRRLFVAQAMQYFRRQDYARLELIVVDNGAEPIADVLSDPRVSYLRTNPAATIGEKRNLACEHAQGQFVVHWDDDDWQASARVQAQVELLLRTEADVCGSNRVLFYEPITDHAWLYEYPSRYPPWVSGSSLCYTRSFWASHRFANISEGEDARFVRQAPANRVAVLNHAPLQVGIIHGRNASPKLTSGSYWSAYSVDAVRATLASDFTFYERLARASTAPSRPASPVRGHTDARRAEPPTRTYLTRTCEVGVVVTCHAPYVRWLGAALASIDRQSPRPAERVVVLDGCEANIPVGSAWRQVAGDWGDPSAARNAGLHATSSPWLIFWDADNIMPDGYLATVDNALRGVDSRLGILYPDLQLCDEALTPNRLRQMPAWDYWAMRAENCIDTAAVWRRAALEVGKGWSSRTGGLFEDYALALDLTAAGWQAAPLGGPPVLMRVHPASRTQARWRQGGVRTDLWRARSLAIVSLLAGRSGLLDRWADFLVRAELPPRTALYVVDNSGDADFGRRLTDICERVARERSCTHLDLASVGQPYVAAAGDPSFVRARHVHIARLYASVLPRVHEDLVLTLEDDVEPPPDAIRRLGEQIGLPGAERVGAVGAAYPMPQDTSQVCAGLGNETWGRSPTWPELGAEPITVGHVGGGCTMWANWALQRLPLEVNWPQGLGWDGSLCLHLRQGGYVVQLHGGVRCLHHVHGQPHTAEGIATP
jgi:glycosyltransferase involved in cell wall biosynthesis